MGISFLLFLQDIRLSSPDVINSFFVALSAFVVGPAVIVVAVLLIVISVIVLIVCCNKPYPMTYDEAGVLLVNPLDMQEDLFKAVGISTAFAISWVIERRFVKFSVEGTIAKKIIRGVIGSIIVLGLFVVILPHVLEMFLDNNWAHFFKYFITLVVAILIYPMCIKAWQNRKANKG